MSIEFCHKFRVSVVFLRIKKHLFIFLSCLRRLTSLRDQRSKQESLSLAVRGFHWLQCLLRA